MVALCGGVEENGRNVDCRVNREVDAIGDAKEVMGAAGRTARRPKLDVRAMSDLAEAMVMYVVDSCR